MIGNAELRLPFELNNFIKISPSICSGISQFVATPHFRISADESSEKCSLKIGVKMFASSFFI